MATAVSALVIYSALLFMADLSVCVDIPDFDSVVVVGGVESANRDEFLSRRLHIAGFVRASRLK